MKSFFKTYAAFLALVEMGFLMGLPMLFDLSRHYFAAGALVALALAVPVHIWLQQETKFEELEKRLQDLENKENQS